MRNVLLSLMVGLGCMCSCLASALSETDFLQGLKQGTFGPEAEFDVSEDSTDLTRKASCEKHILSDDGAPGYYGEHSVFYITYDDQVVFAATSEYIDGTYGGMHGTPDAEARWLQTYARLIGSLGCGKL